MNIGQKNSLKMKKILFTTQVMFGKWDTDDQATYEFSNNQVKIIL